MRPRDRSWWTVILLEFLLLVSAAGFRSASSIQRLSPTVMNSSKEPLLSIGIIADIQYAPVEDGHSFSGTPRYYKHSLVATKHAFETFANYSESRCGVDIVINLGDIIDGKCQAVEEHGGTLLANELHPGLSALLEVENAMKSYEKKVLHTYGNHCLYNLNRIELKEKLGIPFRSEASLGSNDDDDDDHDGDLVGYYSYTLSYDEGVSSVKVIVLDGYDIALMRRCPKRSAKRKAAVKIMKEQNGKNFNEGNENSPEGLQGLQKRFVAFNGAVGPTQLEWLRAELEASLEAQQRVIVVSHPTIHPESSNPVCLIWNFEDVLAVLRDYSSIVMACFAGHAHKGGYVRDAVSGIHFRVLEAVLESKPPTKTFGVLNIYSDRLELEGHGDCQSAVYDLDHCQSSTVVADR